MKNINKPMAVSSGFVTQELDGEMLAYNLATHKAFALNETSALVWQHADGKRTVSDIARAMGKKRHHEVSEELVWLALDDLKKHGLIAVGESELERPPLERRELIKKAALSTAMALPVIMAITAPRSAAAQTNILEQCSVCLTKTHDAVFCDNVCANIIVGDCHDNSGCGQGIFLNLVTCIDCFAALPPMGPGSTVSWHGTQYKV